MLDLVNRVFDVSKYKRLSEINRARIAYGATIILGMLYTLAIFSVPFTEPQRDGRMLTIAVRLQQPQTYPLYMVTVTLFYLCAVVTVVGVYRGYLNRVAFGPALMVYLGLVPIVVANNLAIAQNSYVLLLGVMVAGLLDGERGLLIAIPIHFIALIGGYAYYIGRSPNNLPEDLVLLILASVGLISLLYLFLRNNQVSRVESEVESSQRRFQLAQLTTQITSSISQMSDLETELDRIVESIRTNFPVAYHAQIFLIDPSGRDARLVASTGEVGKKLLERQHSLPVGSLSVIGQVTQRQESIITPVDAEDTIHRPNELLPETRLEVALPLLVGNRNLGALDLQSKNPVAFTEADLTTLEAVANSIAVVIDNTRLIQQTQQRLEENQRLLRQMGETQGEIERLNRELTRTMWTDYLNAQPGDMNVDLNFDDGAIRSADELTDAILDAVNRNDVIRKVEDGRQIVAIPLRVRGEVIGAMEFEVGEELTQEDLDMLTEVGERFGLAAENNRLYQNSQRVAQREALVNEIGTRIQSANSIEATLNEAARSLRDALKAKRVAIQLGTPPAVKKQAAK